jgi:DNA-binding NtrC family response regulator
MPTAARPHVLIVDDEEAVCWALEKGLARDGYSVTTTASAERAFELATEKTPDVVIMDVRLPGMDGLAALARLREISGGAPVVTITAFGNLDTAVKAVQEGAFEYLTKPFDYEQALKAVERAVQNRPRRPESPVPAGAPDEEIVGRGPAMQTVFRRIALVAPRDACVLITGESGTGKELVARALYSQSPRRSRRFVPINCGGIAEGLLESELFGHRKGAFTSAITEKRGLLEEADGGVLFLDEIGEMPLTMQVRLLRFLQGGEVRRMGDTATRHVNVRLVAATHRDLETEVEEGRFRGDFFYRIDVVGIRIPPLRERTDDIPALADFFLRRHSLRLRRPIEGFTPGAVDVLKAHPWPGNARELENAIERAVNLARGPVLSEADLPASVSMQAQPRGRSIPVAERERLLFALEQSRWNQSRAATRLGMSRTTLWRKMREHHIEA